MSSAAETFQAIVNERRSIRAFKSDPVERHVIDAVFAPALLENSRNFAQKKIKSMEDLKIISYHSIQLSDSGASCD